MEPTEQEAPEAQEYAAQEVPHAAPDAAPEAPEPKRRRRPPGRPKQDVPTKPAVQSARLR